MLKLSKRKTNKGHIKLGSQFDIQVTHGKRTVPAVNRIVSIAHIWLVQQVRALWTILADHVSCLFF